MIHSLKQFENRLAISKKSLAKKTENLKEANRLVKAGFANGGAREFIRATRKFDADQQGASNSLQSYGIASHKRAVAIAKYIEGAGGKEKLNLIDKGEKISLAKQIGMAKGSSAAIIDVLNFVQDSSAFARMSPIEQLTASHLLSSYLHSFTAEGADRPWEDVAQIRQNTLQRKTSSVLNGAALAGQQAAMGALSAAAGGAMVARATAEGAVRAAKAIGQAASKAAKFGAKLAVQGSKGAVVTAGTTAGAIAGLALGAIVVGPGPALAHGAYAGYVASKGIVDGKAREGWQETKASLRPLKDTLRTPAAKRQANLGE